jgi:hypothetical protein
LLVDFCLMFKMVLLCDCVLIMPVKVFVCIQCVCISSFVSVS